MTIQPASSNLSMPNATDYRDAFQHPAQAFLDPFLRRGRAECDALGLPRAASGNFASVFYFTSPGGHRYAVRCFRKHVDDRQPRYGAISDALYEVRSPWKVPFKFLPAEVTVGGRTHPAICMEWVDGVGLDRYIKEHLADRAALRATADAFLRLAGDLRAKGIAHGDLQHGNILVTPAGLRLVDYDGVYVPALAGSKAIEFGHRNYQHPERRTRPDFFGPSLDNFSVWVVYLSLVAVAAEPTLWSSVGGGDECLLLREEDFRNPNESNALRLISSIPSTEIQNLLSHFLAVVKLPLEQVPVLSEKHRTTRGPEVFRPSPRPSGGGQANGEPWWKQALRERNRPPGVDPEYARELGGAGVSPQSSRPPQPKPPPPPPVRPASPPFQSPQPVRPVSPAPPQPAQSRQPEPAVPRRSRLGERVALLVATIGIGFLLAVTFATLVSAGSVAFPAAGAVAILFTLDVIAFLTLVTHTHDDMHRKPPDRGI